MAKRTIRYRKVLWKNWVYVSLEENEVDAYVSYLQEQGYIVEK